MNVFESQNICNQLIQNVWELKKLKSLKSEWNWTIGQGKWTLIRPAQPVKLKHYSLLITKLD